MTEAALSSSINCTPIKLKRKNSIYRSLIFWFLLLSIIPLILLSTFNYIQARASLTQAAKQQLYQSAILSNQFLHNWFEERLKEISFQAKSTANPETLLRLQQAWQHSKISLSQYVRSNHWQALSQERRTYFRRLITEYDYLHDVFFIDKSLNILFSVDQEIELGKNLTDTFFKQKKITQTVQQTLATKQTLFSDLENYQHANLRHSGFISTPLFDNNQKLIGAIVFHLTIEPIFNLLMPDQNNSSSIQHYLVGPDGLLRSPIQKNWDIVLNQKVDTLQFKSWLKNHLGKKNSHQHHEDIIEYIGPYNKEVIGVHQTVELLNVQWALISEIDKDEALADANALAKISLALLIITITLIIIIVIWQSRRITDPINKLAQASLKAAEENSDMKIEVNADNEIGVLADALNTMLTIRQEQALEIWHSHQETQQALKDLAAQKYALDQHSLVSVTDRHGNITFANEKFSKVSGYSQQELIGKNHRMLNSGTHSKQMWKEMYQLTNQGLVWHGEVCNKAKSGEFYWVDTTIVPFMDENNNPKSYISIRTDITKRKQIENEIQQSNKQLELVVNNTGVGFWDWQITKGVVDCNNRWYEMTGYSRADLEPFSVEKWGTLLHPDDAQKAMAIIDKHFAGEVEQYICEIRIKHKQGHWIWVLDSGKLVSRNENGEPARMIGTIVDITKRRLNEKITQVKLAVARKLAQQASLNKRLNDAIDELFKLTELSLQAKGGVFLLDAKSQTLKMATHRGEFTTQFLADEKEVQLGCCLCGKSAQSGKIIVSDNCFTDHRHENSWPDMKAHGHYIIPLINHSEDKSTVVGVLFLYTELNPDASEERLVLLQEIGDMFSAAIIHENARQLLKEASKAAAQSSQLKSEFLASMSHEIRTPMNGVIGMLGLLENTPLSKDQAHKVGLAKSSANALLTLINDILDFSKIEAGKLELEFIDFNLRKMLGEFAEAMALKAQEKGLEIILDTTQVEQSMVKGDSGRLRQIFTNLVGNAIKFTEQGEIVITVATEMLADNQLRLSASIKDTGIGIPEDKLTNLFDTFTQVDASTTRKYGGTGLGLAICRNLCQLMGGDIQVTSSLEQGSTFNFTVKLAASEKSQQVLPQIDISRLNLLIVDDNATNRAVLRGQLEHWGATVVEADSAISALNICYERVKDKALNFFDAALLDMQMPDMDGAKLGKTLLAEKKFSQMKLIMMTSISDHNDAQYFANLGFSGFFPKPATTEDILDALAVIVSDGEALAEAPNIVTSDYLNSLNRTEQRSHKKTALAKALSEKITLLLVEDNRINQQVALGILKQFNLQADIANNGLEAIEQLKTHHYHLVLMDCQMPELDGYQATERIRQGEAGTNNKDIPIIAMTANAMQGDKEKCLQAGMSDYLSKPIEPKLLEKKLNKWLNRQSKQQQPTTNTDKLSDKVDNTASKAVVTWDKKSILKRVSHNEALLKLLVQNFINEIPQLLKHLPQEVDSHNIKQTIQQIHNIKGLSANLGALKIQDYCKQIEISLKEKNYSHYSELQAQLQLASTELLDELAQFNSA